MRLMVQGIGDRGECSGIGTTSQAQRVLRSGIHQLIGQRHANDKPGFPGQRGIKILAVVGPLEGTGQAVRAYQPCAPYCVDALV